jgi:hypothetical protein
MTVTQILAMCEKKRTPFPDSKKSESLHPNCRRAECAINAYHEGKNNLFLALLDGSGCGRAGGRRCRRVDVRAGGRGARARRSVTLQSTEHRTDFMSLLVRVAKLWQ